jgi:hypothetical protein
MPIMKGLLRSLAPHWGLAIILVAALTLGNLMARWTLPLETADEAMFLADALDEAGGQDNPSYAEFVDQYEDGNAPRRDTAYRAIYRVAVRLLVDVDRAEPPVRANPYVRPYDPAGTANKNALIFPLADGQLTSVVRLLRGLSLLFMLSATCLVYVTALRLDMGRAAANAAAALCALMPASVIAAASANNEALAALGLAAMLYVTVRAWQAPLRLRSAILCGAIAGLAGLVSPGARLAAQLVPVSMALNARRTHASEPHQRAWLACAVGVGVQASLVIFGLAVVWQTMPPLAWLAQVIRGAQTLTLLTVVERLTMALGGLLGWRNVPLDRVVYTALAALVAISLGGLGLSTVQQSWIGGARRSTGGWWLVVGMALLTAVRATTALLRSGGLLSEGTLAILAPGAILFSAGLFAWLSQQARWALAGGLVAVLLAASLTLIPRPTSASQAVPNSLAALDTEQVIPVGIEYGPELYLVGYDTDRASVPRGETLTVRLVWLARRQPSADYTVSVEVTGRQRMQVGIANTMPGGGRLPTSAWIPGQIVIDEVQVPISAVAQTPSRGDIRVTVYSGSKEQPLEARAPDGASLGVSPRVGVVRLVQPTEVRYAPAAPIRADLGTSVRLLGLNASPMPPVLGAEWAIDLYWQALGPIGKDYTVFAHLVNAYGRIQAQSDAPPMQGDYPTSLWRPNEQVSDRHVIVIPEQVSGEPYFLFVGMYDPQTGERLTYTAADGVTSDHVTLGPLLPATRQP